MEDRVMDSLLESLWESQNKMMRNLQKFLSKKEDKEVVMKKEAIQIIEEYHSLSIDFKLSTPFDVFLKIDEGGNLRKKDLYNYIRKLRRGEEKLEVPIKERIEKEEELLVCDLQPTSDQGKGKN